MESPDAKVRKSVEMYITFMRDGGKDESHAFTNKQVLNVESEKVNKVLDNTLPFVVIKKPGNIELRLNQSLMDKLENDNFGIIRYQPESNEMLDKYKPASDTKIEVVINAETPEHEYYSTRNPLFDVEKVPENTPRRRRDGFLLTNEVHPETVKRIMKIYNESQSYTKSMKEKVESFNKAQSRLADFKKQGKNPWFISKFNELELVSPPKKINIQLQTFERELEIDKLLQKEEIMLTIIEKNKLDSKLLLLDVQQLKQVFYSLIMKEIHLMTIHKEQVRCIDPLVTDSIG
jgi:hypothetical protein